MIKGSIVLGWVWWPISWTNS